MHRIEYWRKKLNISQESLTISSEISQSTISKIESGSRKPSLAMIFKIACGLEICPKEFLACACNYEKCKCTCSKCEIKNPNKRKALK